MFLNSRSYIIEEEMLREVIEGIIGEMIQGFLEEIEKIEPELLEKLIEAAVKDIAGKEPVVVIAQKEE